MQDNNTTTDDKDICPKCGKVGCQCDPNQPCACDENREEIVEEQILDVEESIKKAYSIKSMEEQVHRDVVESFEE